MWSPLLSFEPNERCCCLAGMLSVLRCTHPHRWLDHTNATLQASLGPFFVEGYEYGRTWGWSPRSVPRDNTAPSGAPTDNDNLFVTLFFRSSCLSATTWTIPACWARRACLQGTACSNSGLAFAVYFILTFWTFIHMIIYFSFTVIVLRTTLL